ncbi:hypothetical protein CEE36_01900 [candidate division TA06 bacterium B3_TA06]|uniref:Secretion system C-terminal sorting domain-containing protein n=1 Tax=candidate division TA06 bacterium B3_TA06 TaxID=2012487 RepID=A0A532V9K7_UNCT6|nr:MAG: hypothetical protein CEE36_01900 [candidate division TA06 bacterium B3_TA06]
MHRLLGLDKVWFYLYNYITKETDMKKLGVILILLLFFSVPAQAWERTYGGSEVEEGYSVRETLDGGYIIAGGTYSFGNPGGDVYLIKTDASGDTIWTRTYGGSRWEVGRSVQQTSDEGYIIAGQRGNIADTLIDVYLIKTDASGDTIWTRTYGGSDSDVGRSVQETSDGCYIIAGSCAAGNAVYLIKTDASGDSIWTRTYGGNDADGSNSVCETSDGGYIIAGYTRSFGADEADVYLIKTDADGNSAGIEEDKETRYAPGLLLEVQSLSEGELDLSYFLPGSGLARVELYDAAGKRVGVIEDGERQAGWHHITRPLSLPCGIYFVRLSATLEEGCKLERLNITEKVILLGK